MKTTINLIAVALLATVTMSAQVQKDVQKKTTTKKVRVTDDNQITTKVIEDTDAEIDVIEVEGNDELNQQAKVIKKDDKTSAVVANENVENSKNKMMVAQKQKAQQMELEKSKKMMMEKAEQERMALEKMKKERMAELERRRKELMERPKGMAKLKKDPDGDGIN
jgi:fibronectin type 3 domain-containing protein|tara:strand:+ start:154 stop:648 length:495 start_codon:yes stop_codon:yes gene_type:complete